MIDIPYEEAVAKITEKSGLSAEEIQSKVDEKLSQLSGLISKDGAVHILANELGVELVKKQEPGSELKINEIRLDSRGAVIKGKVVQKWDVKEFEKNERKGKVASLLLGDETGVTRLVFWNDQVDVFEELKEGDILIVKNPFVKESYKKDRLELQLNTQSELLVNPEGVEVEARPAPEPTDRPERQQIYIKDLQGGEQNAELVATVVQVYDPRFYDACPECRKKVTDGNLCPNHGEVTPEVNFSMSAFLDDGTGNIRTNFWKKQALVLTGKSEGEFMVFRDEPTSFETVKTELLGEIIKVVGNVRKNENFDNLDFTAQLVFTEVDPAKEIASLEKKFENERQAPKTEEPKHEAPANEPAPKPKQELEVEEEVISLDDLEEMGK